MPTKSEKSIKVSLNWIIRTIPTKEGWDQNYILLIKRSIERIKLV